MKKIIAISIWGLLILCFSANLQAQISQQDLNQVELMKYYIGTWEAEMGKDSILIWDVKSTPGKGYEHKGYIKIKGEISYYGQGLLGYDWSNQQIVWTHMYANGFIVRDIGQFITETRVITERTSPVNEYVSSIIEMDILTPDKYIAVHKYRRNSDSWDDPVIKKEVWTRVKK